MEAYFLYPKVTQYPKELKIGEDLWEVKFVRKIPDYQGDLVGLCDADEKVLYIRTGQGGKDRFRTFIHEVLHAVHFSLGIDLSKELHRWVYKIEGGFSDFFVENFMDMCILAQAKNQ